MEFVIEEVHFGNLTLVLSVLEKQGCKIFITAKDAENRRIWKTPLLDENGSILSYPSTDIALTEARKKLQAFK